MTTPDDWAELQRIFREALECAPAERDEFLRARCVDEALRSQVRELLEAYEDSAAFLEPPEPSAPILPPERIAGFRILREIGRGGMGVVYEAEQERPRRLVALKVLRTNALSPGLARRFEFETQVLARLHHVGIAQIHEAGTAQIGDETAPYFAMELVRGLPLNHYLRDRRAGVRERLELVARIADAVQHAHHSGVIHRDLKPSNILVTPDGQPKVLDFGVARATDADIQLTSVHTDIGQLIGTLPYMSPEQTKGVPEELDTRSDVYALGVLAFESLTDRLPHDVRRKMPLEAVRTIQEDDATRLSDLDPALRGDVETIVAKALEKERERRYATASDFAADIRRFLNDEPIVARPSSRSYQLAKFAKRNRKLVVASGAFVVLLAVAAVVSTTLAFQRTRALEDAVRARDLAQSRGLDLERAGESLREALERANEAREESERQRAVAQAVGEFLASDVLAQGDPTVNPDRELTIADALDAASSKIGARLANEPRVELALRRVLVRAYQHLRLPERAAEHARRCLELVESLEGTTSAIARSARRDLAVMELDAGRVGAAIEALEQVLAIEEVERPPDHPERLRTMANLASAYYLREDLARADELLGEALERADAAGNVPRDELWRWKVKHSQIRQGMSDYAGALALLDSVSTEQREALGPDHPYVLDTLNSIAALHMEMFRLDEAASEASEVLERSTRVLGPEHLNTASARNVLANILQRQGRFDEALELHSRSLETLLARGPEARVDALSTQYSMASILQATQRLDEAETLAKSTLEAQTAIFGEAHYFPVLSLNLLGMIHGEQGRLDEAVSDYERMIDASTRAFGRLHANTASGINNLASVYERQERFEEARPLFLEVIDLHEAIYGADNAKTWIARGNYAGLLARLGEYEEATPLLTAAIGGLRTSLGAEHWIVGTLLQKEAFCLGMLGRRSEARGPAEEAVRLLDAAFGADHPRTRSARGTLEVLGAETSDSDPR